MKTQHGAGRTRDQKRIIAHPWMTLFVVSGMGITLFGFLVSLPAADTLTSTNVVAGFGIMILLATWLVAIGVASATKRGGWIATTIVAGPVGALLFAVLGPRRYQQYALSRQQAALGGAAVLIVSLSFCGGIGYLSMLGAAPKVAYERRFANVIGQFADIAAQWDASPAHPTFSGKIVIIDQPQKTLDENLLLDARLDGLRAASPGEVTTIIWLQYHEDVIARYTNGDNDYQWRCDLTFIQRSTAQVVGYVQLGGSLPTIDWRERSGDWHGDKPSDSDIISAILAAHTG